MFKAPLTSSVVEDFLSTYRSLVSPSLNSAPFVYVDRDGVRLVASISGEKDSEREGIFALSVAEDGWMEMLATQE